MPVQREGVGMPSPRYLLGYVKKGGYDWDAVEGGYVQRVVMYTGPVMGLGIHTHPSTEPSGDHNNTYGWQVDGMHPTGMLSCV